MSRSLKPMLVTMLIMIGSIFPFRMARAQSPVVHAVLFYSPSCSHCEYVITQVMPPLFDKYGDQLQIVAINIEEQNGSDLFLSVIKAFALDRAGVPFLVIGNQYLMGSADIPEKFPGLIEKHLASGGVDWPAIGGIAEAVAGSQPEAASDSSTTQTSPDAESDVQSSVPPLSVSHSNNWRTNFALDPVGNSISVVVLAGMAMVVVLGLVSLRRPAPIIPAFPGWVFPVLCIAGLFVAGYLAYVEAAQVSAVCGPVGDCNTVQQSEYATLFGILPIGLLGLAGYVLLLLSWVVYHFNKGRLSDFAALAMLVMTAGGLMFSIYLTFLEPFVIGATCAWCITSAVLMTLLFLLSLDPGKRAVRELAQSR